MNCPASSVHHFVNIPQGKTDIVSLDLYMEYHIEIVIEYFNSIMTEKWAQLTQC